MEKLQKILEGLGGVGLFGGLLYYIGRRYIEQYYCYVGVPNGEVNLIFSDYVYHGAQPIQLLIVGIFTIMGFVIWKLFTINNNNQACETSNRYIMGSIYIVVLSFTGAISLIYIVFLQNFLAPQTLYEAINWNLAILITILVVTIPSTFYNFDKNFTSWLKYHKNFQKTYLVCCIVTVIFLPYLAAGCYGSLKGINDVNNGSFETVSLEVNIEQNNEISWEKTINNTYAANDLHLVYISQNNFFVKTSDNKTITISIPIKDISTYSITKN